MSESYENQQLLDRDGQGVGTIEREWVDDTGRPYFIQVALGRIFAKHRLVPLHGARQVGTDLQVTYPKAVIEASPDISGVSDMMEGAPLAEIVRYYRRHDADHPRDEEAADPIEGTGDRVAATSVPGDETWKTPPTGERRVGEVRDLGDVIEIPIVEEEVTVTRRPVVKEILRIQKRTVTEQQSVQTETRHEEIEIEEGQDLLDAQETMHDTQ